MKASLAMSESESDPELGQAEAGPELQQTVGNVEGSGNIQNLSSQGGINIHNTVINYPHSDVLPVPLALPPPLAASKTGNVIRTHKQLALALDKRFRHEDIDRIKFFFNDHPELEVGDLSNAQRFIDIWAVLDRKRLISLGSYTILEEAFGPDAIDAAECLAIIASHQVPTEEEVIAERHALLTAMDVIPLHLRLEKAGMLQKRDERVNRKEGEMTSATDRYEEEKLGYVPGIKVSSDSIDDHIKEKKRHQTEVDKYLAEKVKHRDAKELYRSKMEHHDAEMEKARQGEERHELEVERHRIEIERKLEKKARKMAEVERIGREKEDALKKIENECEKDCQEINAGIERIAKLQKDIKDAQSQADELVAQKILRPGLYSDIKKLQERLKEMGGAADVVTGRSGCYSSGRWLCSLDGQAGKEFGVNDLVDVTSDCLVACSGWKAGGGWVGGVWKWMLPSKTPTVIMQDEVPFISVAALGKDEVVVLAWEAPCLRIIDVRTEEHVRSIDVQLDRSLIESLHRVEVDDHGRFLITAGKRGDMQLFLVNKEGSILHDIPIGYQYLPTFCRMRGMAVLCSNLTDLITCYKPQNGALTEVISAPHGEQGFRCGDICSGSSGEIFITGWMEGMEPEEVRVYQAEIDAEKETVEMKRIRLDTELRCSEYAPRCAFRDNILTVRSDDGGVRRISVFQLSP